MARNDAFGRHTVFNVMMYAIVLFLLLHVSHGAESVDGRVCNLSEDIRPVVYAQGFLGSPLFDSSNQFTIEFLDSVDFSADSPDNGGEGDLNLPLTWDASNLTQAQSPVGPEGSPDDVLTGIKGIPNKFITDVRFYTFCTQRATPDHAATLNMRAARSQCPSSL